MDMETAQRGWVGQLVRCLAWQKAGRSVFFGAGQQKRLECNPCQLRKTRWRALVDPYP